MILSLVYLAVLALIALAALGVGRPVIRALVPSDEVDEIGVVVWSTAVGLVLCGGLWMVLGLLGGLYPALIRVLTLSAAAAGVVQLAPLWRSRRLRLMGWVTSRDDLPTDTRCEPDPRWVGVGRWLLAMIAAATLISALAPPVAGDALCYHLELPKRFLLEHALVELPHDDNAVYPLLTEMWYLWGLALGGATTAQLLHWLCGGLLAGGVMLLATPIVGRRWSELAAVLALLTPGMNNQMTAPLNDLAVAALTTLALAAWWRAIHAQHGTGWYLLAGVLLGGALATKHVALLFGAALASASLWLIVQHAARRAALLRGLALLGVVAVSVAGPWYVRAAWYRGDPVYPFLSGHAVAQAPVSDHENEVAAATRPDKRKLGRGVLAAITALWQTTMQPELVGGRAHQIGPLWLALLPGLVLTRRLRGLGMLLAIGGLFAILWFGLRQNARFLLPAIPLLAVGAVWVLSELRRWPRAPRVVTTLMLLGLTLFLLAIPLRRAVKSLPVAMGVESREAFLRRVEPTYDIARKMRELDGGAWRVLSQEQRAFYLPSRITRESIYRRHTQYHESHDGESWTAQLRSAGFTHLLVVDVTGGDTTYDDTLNRLVAEAPESLECICETTFTGDDGGERRYRLLNLRSKEMASVENADERR
ncbi:MAG: glycosyltransferase family 39 protein [Planctomycetaceae bacterium]|nr:glycosyltransferase family 39 protein [Planctomycetaceae bacterium]